MIAKNNHNKGRILEGGIFLAGQNIYTWQRGKFNRVLLISWSSARVQFGPASVPLGNDMLGRKKVLQEVVSIQNVGERVLSFKFLVAERTRLQARVARHFDLEQI